MARHAPTSSACRPRLRPGPRAPSPGASSRYSRPAAGRDAEFRQPARRPGQRRGRRRAVGLRRGTDRARRPPARRPEPLPVQRQGGCHGACTRHHRLRGEPPGRRPGPPRLRREGDTDPAPVHHPRPATFNSHRPRSRRSTPASRRRCPRTTRTSRSVPSTLTITPEDKPGQPKTGRQKAVLHRATRCTSFTRPILTVPRLTTTFGGDAASGAARRQTARRAVGDSGRYGPYAAFENDSKVGAFPVPLLPAGAAGLAAAAAGGPPRGAVAPARPVPPLRDGADPAAARVPPPRHPARPDGSPHAATARRRPAFVPRLPAHLRPRSTCSTSPARPISTPARRHPITSRRRAGAATTCM